MRAEEALPVAEIDRAAAESRRSDARDDLLDSKDAIATAAAERQIKVAEEMLKAAVWGDRPCESAPGGPPGSSGPRGGAAVFSEGKALSAKAVAHISSEAVDYAWPSG